MKGEHALPRDQFIVGSTYDEERSGGNEGGIPVRLQGKDGDCCSPTDEPRANPGNRNVTQPTTLPEVMGDEFTEIPTSV